MSQAALHTCVGLVDRATATPPAVPVHDLQLLGVAALLVGSKFVGNPLSDPDATTLTVRGARGAGGGGGAGGVGSGVGRGVGQGGVVWHGKRGWGNEGGVLWIRRGWGSGAGSLSG